MFIEGRNDTKTPFYVHVDVATTLIIGHALKDKTYGSVHHAIEFIDDQHKLWRRKLECKLARGYRGNVIQNTFSI